MTGALGLEPYPDVLLDALPDRAPGPGARYGVRESMALAFVAGLQRLPAGQRAVLVLRDVLGFRAAEVADMLGIGEAAVDRTLLRARAALEACLPARDRERAPLPRSARERAVVDRFADAVERGDVDGVVALLTDDALLALPPLPPACEGPAAIARFLSTGTARGRLDRCRLVATRANGQPAFGVYRADPVRPIARGAGIVVLTLAGDRVAAITVFRDAGALPRFGLPRTLRSVTRGERAPLRAEPS